MGGGGLSQRNQRGNKLLLRLSACRSPQLTQCEGDHYGTIDLPALVKERLQNSAEALRGQSALSGQGLAEAPAPTLLMHI